jgi:hypothetical protein
MAKPYCNVEDIAPATAEDIKALTESAVQRIVENDIDNRDWLTPEAVRIVALIERSQMMAEALMKWPCASCGGAGSYLNRNKARGAERIPCKVCGGSGKHPIATTALEGFL